MGLGYSSEYAGSGDYMKMSMNRACLPLYSLHALKNDPDHDSQTRRSYLTSGHD